MSRFFHSLVVFGAGASLAGCGGKTLDSSRTNDPEAGGATGTGSGGAVSIGSAGGTVNGFGGGLFGGGDVSGSGGAPIDAGPVPDPSTFAQWNCTDGVSCEYGSGRTVLDAPCPVDPTRPRSAADCTAGQWFECDGARFHGRPVSVDCRCTPAEDSGASCATCAAAVLRTTDEIIVVSCNQHERLCGCALTRILR